MKKAFSLIEMIIVIAVIGILAVNMMPNAKESNRIDAMKHVLSMIRYTQNLALHDNKHSDNVEWQKRYWRFGIYRNDTKYLCFKVASDDDASGLLLLDDAAVDPANGKRLYCPNSGSSVLTDARYSPNVFLYNKFGLKKADFKYAGGASFSASYLSFDKFGRPHASNGSSGQPIYSSYVKKDVNITFTFDNTSTKQFSVIINKETGYAHIDGNDKL